MTYPNQDLSTFKLPEGFRGRSALTVQLWWIVQDTLFRCSPQFMYGWRRFLLRLFGAKIGRSVLVRPTVRITYPWKLTIGNYGWVGDYVELYTLGRITIGNHAVVSQYAYLCTGSHDHHSRSFDIYQKPIVIEDEAWVASGVFVYPGVKVGRGAVVSSRSVLTTDADPYWVYTGHPAKASHKRVLNEVAQTHMNIEANE